MARYHGRTNAVRRRRPRRTKRKASKPIARLQRQIRALTKRSVQAAQFDVRLEDTTQATGLSLTDNEFYCTCLTRPNAWINIFQTIDQATVTAQELRMNSFDLQFIFSPVNSEIALTPRVVDLYLLKLKKETAMDTLAATGNMSTVGLNAANNDIVHKSVVFGGAFTMIKWNPAAVEVLHHRNFTVANIMEETGAPESDTVLSNTFNALTRARMRGRMGNHLKPVKGPALEMAELDTMPNDRYYVVAHVGGWSGGTSQLNGVHMDTNFTLGTSLYI